MGIFSWLRGGSGAVLEDSRRHHTSLPRSTARDLDFLGRFWIQRAQAAQPEVDRATSIAADLESLALADPQAFCRDVRAVAEAAGGWAEYGAIRLITEILGHVDGPDTDYLMESSLAFVRSRKVDFALLSPDAQEWWHRNLPGVEWRPRRGVPAPGMSRLTPLQFGQERVLARFDANKSIVLVRNEGGLLRTYQRYVDVSGSFEFPDEASTDLYALYVKVGRDFETCPDWVDPELAPFVTVERADFS